MNASAMSKKNTATPAKGKTNPFASIDKRILADSGISGDAAANLLSLCDDIGPRFAGTDGYRRAAKFMEALFQSYKLDRAELEPFEFVAWRRGAPARFRTQVPGEREIPCYELPYSAGTGGSGISAGIVDIATGSDADLQAHGNRIKGRLVLTTGTAGHRTAIYEKCEALGATGFILEATSEGMLLATGSVANGRGGTLPAISIGSESAAFVRRLKNKGPLRFHLQTHGHAETDTTWNVVGEITGTEKPDELVIIGGHLDSHELSPGAFDNGAGVVLVMEVARLLSKQRPHLKRTVRFIGFAGEEVGLLGSHYHARTHARALRKARFMFNCDTPAFGQPRGLGFHKCPKGAPYLEMISEEMGIDVHCDNREHCYSDHYPFILQGVPTAGVAGGKFGSHGKQYPHMAADTPDKIPLDELRDRAAFMARLVVRAANDERWPRMRRTAAEIKEWAQK